MVWSVMPRPIHPFGSVRPLCRAIFADSRVPADSTTVRPRNSRTLPAKVSQPRTPVTLAGLAGSVSTDQTATLRFTVGGRYPGSSSSRSSMMRSAVENRPAGIARLVAPRYCTATGASAAAYPTIVFCSSSRVSAWYPDSAGRVAFSARSAASYPPPSRYSRTGAGQAPSSQAACRGISPPQNTDRPPRLNP